MFIEFGEILIVAYIFIFMSVNKTNACMCYIVTFFFSNWRALDSKTSATTKARSGDLFIMGAPDRQITVTPYKGMDSLASMPYLLPGIWTGTFDAAAGSPKHNIAW